MLQSITPVEFEWARYLIYTRYKLTHFCVRGTSGSSKIIIRLGSKRSKIGLSKRKSKIVVSRSEVQWRLFMVRKGSILPGPGIFSETKPSGVIG